MQLYRQLLPYGIAVCSTGVAICLSLRLEALINRPTVILFFIAVAISTWFGGSRPGIVAIVLSVLAINHFLISPVEQLLPANAYDFLWLILFVVVAFTIIGLIANLQHSMRKIEQLSRQLLEESSDRLQGALNAAQVGMWDWDRVTGRILWSPKLEQLFGLTPGQFDGRYETVEAWVHPEDRPGLNQSIEDAVRDRTPYCYEFRVVWADGSVHWLEGRGQAFYNEAGTAVRMTGTVMAIDRRKQAEVALQESQAQLQRQLAEIETIYQNAPIGLAVFDSELRFVKVNNRWAKMKGFPVEAYIGHTMRELLPDLADTTEQLLRPILETGEPRLNVEITGEIPAQPGITRTWVGNFLPLRDSNPSGGQSQRIIGISVVCEDITDRKQAEAALQESEARLRLAQAVSNSAVWDFDIRTSNVIWSPEYYQLYQLDPNTESSYDNWLQSIHPEDRERTHQQALQAIADKLSEIRFEFRVPLSGEIRWFSSIGQLIHDEAGEPIRIIGITIDITQQKQTEIALQELNAELEQRVAERTSELAALNDRLLVAYQEQAQIQKALQESEERRRLALDLTHIASWDYDFSSGELIWSDHHFTLLGLAPGSCEPTLELVFSHVHPDDVSWVVQGFLNSLKNHTDYVAEHRVIRADRSVRWLMVRAKAIYDEAGEPVRSLGVLLDVTDRKLAELALQQQARLERLRWNITQEIRQSLDLPAILNTAVEQLRQTLQVDRVAVYRFHPDWSGEFLAESVGSGWPQLVGPGVQKVWNDTYLQETQGGRFRHHESFVIRNIYTAGLQPCHIELLEQFQAKAYAVVPIFSAASVWGLLAVYQNVAPYQWEFWEIELLQQIASQLAIAIHQSDLYEQVQSFSQGLEQQVQQRTTQLHQSLDFEALLKRITDRVRDSLDEQQILQAVVEELAHGLPIAACDTGIYDAEQTTSTIAYEFVNNSLDPAQGQTFEIDTAPHFEIYPSLFRGQTCQFCDLSPNPLRSEQKLMCILAVPLLDDQGILGDLWLFKLAHRGFDELEVRLVQQIANQCAIALRQSRLYQAAQAQVTELERLNQLKDDFLSTVSHELRTPMANIKMAIQMLEVSLNRLGVLADESTPVHRYFNILREEGQRELSLINDLLDLTRLDAGTEPLDSTEIHLQAYIPHIAEPFIEQAHRHQQQLILQIPADLPAVSTHLPFLERILTELLNNACKYTPAGETIHLSAQETPERIEICVCNSGVEIPSEEYERIFDKFYRVPNRDPWKHPGTGLGLALVKRMVNQMGGTIAVKSSTEPNGTTFTIHLPYLISLKTET